MIGAPALVCGRSISKLGTRTLWARGNPALCPILVTQTSSVTIGVIVVGQWDRQRRVPRTGRRGYIRSNDAFIALFPTNASFPFAT